MEINDKTQKDTATLRTWIAEADPKSVVFFGGAGVSTESGIPDFRSPDGLYRQKYGDTSPEELISHHYYRQNPQRFFEFYFDRMIAPDAQPNQAHKKLAELEQQGILDCVITQNIDGLHQKAGSKRVFELHGSVLRNYCQQCGAAFDLERMTELHNHAEDGVPRCPQCGGAVKPDVVLYEESLDQETLMNSMRAISRAKTLIIAGTSLVVYPAAGLVDYFNGEHLVIVNLSPTPRDRQASLCIAAPVGKVFDF